jgi:hypothetical protein
MHVFAGLPLRWSSSKSLQPSLKFWCHPTHWANSHFICCCNEVRLCLWKLWPLTNTFAVHHMMHKLVCSISAIMLTWENWRTWKKTCPGATLSATNSTWTSLSFSLGLHSEKPAANCPSYSMAQKAFFVYVFTVRSICIFSVAGFPSYWQNSMLYVLIFWVVMLCWYQHSRGTYFLHLQPWRWRHYVPSKCLYLPTSPQGLAVQKTNISIFTAVWTSDLMQHLKLSLCFQQTFHTLKCSMHCTPLCRLSHMLFYLQLNSSNNCV